MALSADQREALLGLLEIRFEKNMTRHHGLKWSKVRAKLEANVRAAGFHPLQIVPTSHSYTLWGLGGPFRAPGYYQTSALAETLGKGLRVVLPWAFNFSTLVVARKP